MSSGLSSALSTVTGKFSSIYSTISSKMSAARDAVGNAISALKSKFNFSWSLPHLKLPHVSISGSFSINPPSVPHFGISWYKDGGILTRPTIFGAAGNNLLAGGEAGAEAVVPLATLWDKLETMITSVFNTASTTGGSSGEGLTSTAGRLLTLDDFSLGSLADSRNMYGRVKIVPICAGGQIPSEDVLADVLAACSADDVRPLTDMVTVEAPETHEYDIELTYYTTKANESEVVQNVEGSGGAIDQYINWQGSTLNQDINPDELRKRILCPDWADDLIGATRVQITKPEYTELNSTTVAKFSGKKTVKHIVKG